MTLAWPARPPPSWKPSSYRSRSSPSASSATRPSSWRWCWPRATPGPGRSSPASSSPRSSITRSPAGSARGCARAVPEHMLRWLLALSFFAVAAWALKPDKLDEDEQPPSTRWGVFGVTTVAFFLAEIGDKTQIATVMLAARFDVARGGGDRHDARHDGRERAGRCSPASSPRRAFRSRRCASPPRDVRGARRVGTCGGAAT